MSESVLPWIAAHLIGLAEEYGANTPAIAPYTKKKKVQLVEFLTYDPDEIIWARASDKEYLIPVRFNRDAVQEYTRLSGNRLTQHKTAIVCISNFKPIFTRIPQVKGRLSPGKFLALECDSFSVLGSLGEARFGNPRPLEANGDLREWSEGLKQDGGAGNCLRDRKQVQQEALKKSSSNAPVSTIAITKSTTSPSKQTARKKASSNLAIAIPKKRNGIATTSGNVSRDSPEIWPITKKAVFRRPPDDVGSLLASMKVHGEEDSLSSDAEQNSETHMLESPRKRRRISALLSPSPAASQSGSRFRSATPLPEEEWPASDRPRSASPLAPPSPSLSPAKASATSSSHPRPPTPAQRIPRRGVRSMSPSNPPSPTRPKAEPLPPSSPPLPSHVTIAPESVLMPPSTVFPPTHTRREVTRKVPRPPQPLKSRPMADPIILVPNSDNSLSYSQSQSQSQPHVQSPFRKKSPGSSQPVILSQLSELTRVPERPKAESQMIDPVDKSQTKEYLENCEQEDLDIHNPFLSQDLTQARDYDGDQLSTSKSPVTHRAHADAKERRNVPTSRLPNRSHTDDDYSDDGDLFNAGLASPSDPAVEEIPSEDDLVGASLAAEPATTQPQPPLNHDDYPAIEDTGSIETHSHNLHDKVDKKPPQPIDINHDLDEDDAETHVNLFGPGAPHTQRARCTRDAALPTASLRAPVADPPLIQAPGPSNADISEEAKFSTLDQTKERSGDSGPALDVAETRHDPAAWVLPSFLRPSSTTSKPNIAVQSPLVTTTTAKPTSTLHPNNEPMLHALAKSRLLNGQRPLGPTSQVVETSHRGATPLSNNSSTSKNRSDEQSQGPLRDDQNSDPSRRARLSTETRAVPSQNKRGRDPLPDDSLPRDKVIPSAKKRRVDKDLMDEDLGGVTKKQLAREYRANQPKKPMVRNLVDPLKLDELFVEEKKRQTVTWLELNVALRLTYRDRLERSR